VQWLCRTVRTGKHGRKLMPAPEQRRVTGGIVRSRDRGMLLIRISKDLKESGVKKIAQRSGKPPSAVARARAGEATGPEWVPGPRAATPVRFSRRGSLSSGRLGGERSFRCAI
jgi:hypothetical protein